MHQILTCLSEVLSVWGTILIEWIDNACNFLGFNVNVYFVNHFVVQSCLLLYGRRIITDILIYICDETSFYLFISSIMISDVLAAGPHWCS